MAVSRIASTMKPTMPTQQNATKPSGNLLNRAFNIEKPFRPCCSLRVLSESIDWASLAEICPSNRNGLADFGAFYIYGNGAEFL